MMTRVDVEPAEVAAIKASKTHHGFSLFGNEDGALAEILKFNRIVLNGDEGSGIT